MKKTFLKKGMREIWAHKAQYLMLTIMIGLGVAAYSSFNDFARYRKDGLDQIYSESNFMDLQVTIFNDTLDPQIVHDIFEENGVSPVVENWEMRLVYEVFLKHEHNGEPKITKGQVMGQFVPAGETPGEALKVNTPLFYLDDPDAYSEGDGSECYIERKFSKVYGLEPGESINVNRGNNSLDLKIIEQVAVPEYFFVLRENDLAPSERSFGVVLLPIDTAMGLYSNGEGNENLVNDIVMTFSHDLNRTELKNIEARIQTAFEAEGVAVKFTEKDENPARYFLISDYENDKDSMSIFPTVIFIVAAFGLVMALRRMVRAHRPEIGIFKALGLPNRAIMVFYTIIGIVIALLGTLMGFLLSIPFNWAFLRLGKRMFDFPVDDYNISYIYYVYGALISIVLCLACTLIPAALAVRVKPIDIIQGREGTTKKQVGRLGGILGKVGFLPVSLKLTLRNQLRKPFRSLSTMVGVGLSLALFLGFMMVLQSALVALDKTTSELEWDYEIKMEGFQPFTITEGWDGEHPEIDQVVPGIMLPSQFGPEDDEVGILLYSSQELGSIYTLELKDGGISEGKVIISDYLSRKLGIFVGEMVPVEILVMDDMRNFSIEIIEVEVGGIHTNHLGSYAFMTLPSLQNVTGLRGMVNVAHILTRDNIEIREFENDLITRNGISSVTHSSENENIMEQYMDILIWTVMVMAVISTILAGAIVYIMFKISAREQERDYATMKTLGTTLGKVAKLIYQEAVFVTSFGIGLGVIGGYGMAYLLLNQEEYEMFNMDVLFSWPAFFGGSAMIIAAVMFVSLFTLRYIGKINIANVIRERVVG
ncbi:MAG: FtsX-like permease family protein [Candidatus Thermoplasmatota archaeon]|nr:FtsX-like permease family protein [Candidatus Thermoplasmatota archaeon]